MIFRLLDISDKKLIEEYRNFFLNNEEPIPGAAGLEESSNIENWIKEKLLETSKETLINKNFVPATTFLLIDNNTLVGIINLRHELNDYLLNFGGHIGYSIRADYRRKGLAKFMLQQTLLYAFEKLKLDKVLITCNSINIASEKTILSCGGKLENIIEETDRITKRFWIYKKED